MSNVLSGGDEHGYEPGPLTTLGYALVAFGAVPVLAVARVAHAGRALARDPVGAAAETWRRHERDHAGMIFAVTFGALSVGVALVFGIAVLMVRAG